MGLIDEIAEILMIIGGIFIYIFGLIGNTLNIYVFAKWCCPPRRINNIHQNNQNNSAHGSNSALYLLVSSCANFMQIVYPVLTRIIFDGFQVPKTKSNQLVVCQLRYYVLHTSDLISLTCICMATLDRYLISSRNIRVRRLASTRQRAKLVILLIVCLSGLHNIPIAFYYQASDTDDCVIISEIYNYYYLFVIQVFLHGIFPMCILLIFGGLTYKQLRTAPSMNQRRNFNSDRQLSRMILLLCTAIFVSSVPYIVQNLYFAISKDFNYQPSSYALLIYYICLLSFFTNATLSFYIFLISTPNFRKELKKLFEWIRLNGNLANILMHVNTNTQNSQ